MAEVGKVKMQIDRLGFRNKDEAKTDKGDNLLRDEQSENKDKINF